MAGKRRRPSAWQQWKTDRAQRKDDGADDDGWRDETQTIPAVRSRDDTEVLAALPLTDDTAVISPVPLRADIPGVRAPRHQPPAEDRSGAPERRERSGRGTTARSQPAAHGGEASEDAETAPRPLYARVLFLRTIDPGPVLCFFFFEGAIAAGATLALAGLVPWWAVAVLPATVAAMVKLNDVVAASARRRAGRLSVEPESQSEPEPVSERRPSDPVKEAHLEWRRGMRTDLAPAAAPTERGRAARERSASARTRSREARDVFPYDGRSRDLPSDW
jgi:hypothetical protein